MILADVVSEAQASLQALITAVYWWIGSIILAFIVFSVIMYRHGKMLKDVRTEFDNLRKDINAQAETSELAE